MFEPATAPEPIQNESHSVRVSMDEEALVEWLAQALPGQAIEYHRGLLGRDRVPSSLVLPHRECTRLAKLANRASRAAAAGEVVLFQRRHDLHDFSYLAVKCTPATSRILETW